MEAKQGTGGFAWQYERLKLAYTELLLDSHGIQSDVPGASPGETTAADVDVAEAALDAHVLNMHEELMAVCRLAIINEARADGLRGQGLVDDSDIKALRGTARVARTVLAKAEGGTA